VDIPKTRLQPNRFPEFLKIAKDEDGRRYPIDVAPGEDLLHLALVTPLLQASFR
jgi:hypothetical protein